MKEVIEDSPGAECVSPEVRDALVNFKSGKDDPVVAYVSKVVSIPESELPSRNRRRGGGLTAEEAQELGRRKREELAKIQAQQNGGQGDSVAHMSAAFAGTGLEGQSPTEGEPIDPEHLIGFARIYSGRLSVGDSIYVLPPKWTPQDPHASPKPQKVTVTALYLLMGRALEHLETVPAGVVFGIAGLEGSIMKTGTLCSQVEGAVNLAGVSLASPPIVRVALEPVNPADLQKMITGLKLLERSDPCAQYEVLPSGEHVILTAGELHLERCLKDLRERFAKCEIQAGEAIVPYRESIVSAPEMNPPKNPDLPRGTVTTASKQLSIRLRVCPLPVSVTEFLSKNTSTIKKLNRMKRGQDENQNTEDHGHDSGDTNEMNEAGGDISSGSMLSVEDFKKQLRGAFDEAKEDKEAWNDVIEHVMEFGPRRTGPNVLIDATADGSYEKL